MKIFVAGKNKPLRRAHFVGRDLSPASRNYRTAGNVFFALFAAVAMVGAVGYGFNTVLRGPITGMTEVTRRTVAESTVVTSSRVAIVGATTQQTTPDCDADGFVEPMPYRDAGAATHPTGGGYLPTGLINDMFDPWKTEYGYCAWDAGPKSVSDAVAGCGGLGAKRLQGSPDNKQYTIAIVSAGKDKKFQTTCSAYNGASPTASLITRTPGSDDIVLGYTYAEANDLGAGMWRPSQSVANTAETRNALEGTKDATFADKVVLQGNVLTGGGLVLPGDPGDDSLTGPCNSANDKQIRRNLSTTPPSLEICNFGTGPVWSPLSGTSSATGALTGTLVSHWKLNETAGTTAVDSVGGNNGTLSGGTVWTPTDGIEGGSLKFLASQVVVPRAVAMEPTAVTLAAWIKPETQTVPNTTIARKGIGDGATNPWASYDLGFYGSSTKIAAHVGAPSYQELVSDKPVNIGAWNHVAMSYDPSTSAGNFRIYINGQLAGTADLTTPISYDATSTGVFLMGTAVKNDLSNWPYKGLMDDVRIYNYQLSDAEIYALYNTSKTSVMKNTTPAKKGRVVVWGVEFNGEFADGAATTTYQSPASTRLIEDFVQVAAGVNHACGVRAGGTAWCWGNDSNGKLGNGAGVTADQTAANLVTGLTNVVKVTASDEQSCALKRDGTAWCWGDNAYYQLGDGTNTDSAVPVQVADITDFIDISTGYRATCGLRNNGTVMCWGAGTTGLMGNGTNTSNQRPGPVSTVTDFTTIHVSHMYAYACGATKTGKGYCWGDAEQNGNYGDGGTTGSHNTPQQISNITDFVDVQLVNTHGCGLRASGEVWCWGNDTLGKLGNGSSVTADQTVPVKADFLYNAVKLNVMKSGTCAVTAGGEVWCWGSDTNGKIGNGPAITANKESPAKSGAINIVDIAGHHDAIFTIMDTSVIPPKLNANGVGKVSASNDHSCAIDDDGTAWCWGDDAGGQLGNGATTGTQEFPSKVTDFGPWMQITSAGAGTNCGIKFDTSMQCWGSDTWGMIGNGATTTTTQTSPIDSGTNEWISLSGGYGHICGVKKNGSGWCWGQAAGGVLGNNSSSGTVASPFQLTGTAKWKKISAGYTSTCGIQEDGSAWCWGTDTNGALGNGASVSGNQLTPYKVADPGPWADITSGASFVSCGIKMDGSLWCWGDSTGAGINSTVSSALEVPTMVHEPGPWAMIDQGSGGHICAVKVDGSLWCWGPSSYGQLGNKATTGGAVPEHVYGGQNDWITVSVGTWHSCAMKKDHSVWCWGRDNSSQLGNGPNTTADQTVPGRVMNLQHRAPFTASADGGGLNMLPGLVADIGTTRLLSANAAGDTGFGFTGSGRSIARVSAADTVMNVQISSVGNAASPQLGLKTKSATAAYASAMMGSNIAYYWFGPGSGTTIIDSSGNGYDATMEDGAGWTINGKWGGGGTFDATDDAAQTPNNATFQNATELSITVWVYKDTFGGTDDIIAKATEGGAYDWYLKTLNKGAISWSVGTNTLTTTTPFLTAGRWQNITVTFSNTAAQSKIYVDGILVATQTGLTPVTFGTHPVRMGGTWTGEGLEGMLDEIRIYNHVLSDMDAQNLYLGGFEGAQMARLMGVDYATGNFEIARDPVNNWLTSTFPDLEISYGGDVGLGTLGAPQAKLDVNGAVKVGADGGACNAGKAGAFQWTGAEMQYCDGSAWKTWKSYANLPWQTGKGQFSAYCGLKADGTAWCWAGGYLGNGQSMGTNALAPVQVQTDTGPGGWNDWTQIGSDGWHSCGLRANGTIWCWGAGNAGQLGDGTGTTRTRPVQVQTDTGPGGWNDWIQLTLGTGYGGMGRTCGLRTNGTIWCWGSNTGDGTGNHRQRPVQVQTDTGPGGWNDWVQVSSGDAVTCGIRADGSAWCWGSNYYGAAGDGTSGVAPNDYKLRPVRVVAQNPIDPPWGDWVQISAMGLKTCGIRADGSAWCWGHGGSGQLGCGGPSPDESRPCRVVDNVSGPGWNDWISLAPAPLVSHHACGIRADGSAWCWGGQYTGQGGNGVGGGVFNTFTPSQVQTNTGPGGWNDWVSLALGSDHTCGLRADGSAWCWGDGGSGNLANGSVAMQTRPTKVMGSP